MNAEIGDIRRSLDPIQATSIMHPALFKLFVLLTKGTLRGMFRRANTVRGVLLLVFTLGIAALMVLPAVAAALVRNDPDVPSFHTWLEPYLPFMILGLCLLVLFTSATERAFYFNPAEVDFLFPAPLDRRDLLVYKLAKMVAASFILAIFVSTTSLIFFRSFFPALVGIWLTLIFIQLLGLIAALLSQIVIEQAYTITRKFALLAIVLLLLAGIVEVYSRIGVPSAIELARTFRQTWAGTIVLAPFLAFSFAIMAGRAFPDLALWGSLCAGIDLGLFILIVRLDADYLESAAAVSQKVYEQVQRARQSGGFVISASSKGKRFRLPPLPWLGGAGPIAWRQILLAVRTSRAMILTFVILGAFFGGWTAATSRGFRGAGAWSGMALGMLAYLTFLCSFQLPWAFRGDIDHIDSLKTLPIRPLVLAGGELAGGISVLLAMQLSVVVLFGLLGMSPPILATVAVFALPVDALLLAINNVIFLIYPVRFVPSGAADFQFMGRAMVFMLLQMLALSLCLGLAAALGGIAYFISGASWLVFGITSWTAIVLELLPFLWALGWAFDRFDPATQTPAN